MKSDIKDLKIIYNISAPEDDHQELLLHLYAEIETKTGVELMDQYSELYFTEHMDEDRYHDYLNLALEAIEDADGNH